MNSYKLYEFLIFLLLQSSAGTWGTRTKTIKMVSLRFFKPLILEIWVVYFMVFGPGPPSTYTALLIPDHTLKQIIKISHFILKSSLTVSCYIIFLLNIAVMHVVISLAALTKRNWNYQDVKLKTKFCKVTISKGDYFIRNK